MTGERLTRRFYRRGPVTVAKALLGQILVRRLDDGQELTGRIVETEAYLGTQDKASHSYGGRRTQRNESMYLDGGHAYVYFVYGMHWCFNVVTQREGVPSAVLIRALEPLAGLDAMRHHRGRQRLVELCSGPGKLGEALRIDRTVDGVDLTSSGELFVRRARSVASRTVLGPRIGVDYAGGWADKHLRFWIADNPNASRRKKRLHPDWGGAQQKAGNVASNWRDA